MDNNNTIVNIPYFFRDFVGSMEDFRILLQNLNAGTAGPQYGTPEEQQQLLAELHRGFVGGHPTMSTDSIDDEDFGQWLYYNGVFYPTNGNGGEGGTQGPAGPAGPAGPTGPAGATGPRGMQGTQGFQGEIGIQGIQGIAGNIFMVQGIQGIQGIQGYPGMIVSGVIGENGEIGITGTQGMAGIQGPAGVRGSRGIQGTQGLQGLPGTQGLQGSQGIQGEDGLQGIRGFLGIQGYVGYNGFQGPRGTQGYPGLQGLEGTQGTQGLEGIQGTQGIQGDQGTQGSQGPNGIQGTQGAQGLQGAEYIVAGMMGAQGIQGAQGPIGYVGMQGVQGIDGSQGYPGIQGADYIIVCYGVQGTSGADDAFYDLEIDLTDPNSSIINMDSSISDAEPTILHRWTLTKTLTAPISTLQNVVENHKQLRVHFWDENEREAILPALIYRYEIYGSNTFLLQFRLDVSNPVVDNFIQTVMGSCFYDISIKSSLNDSNNNPNYVLEAIISKGVYNAIPRNESYLQNANTLNKYNSPGSYLIRSVQHLPSGSQDTPIIYPEEFGRIANEQSYHTLFYKLKDKDINWIVDHHRDWFQSGKPSWTIVDARGGGSSFNVNISFDWDELRTLSDAELLGHGAPNKSVFLNKIHKFTLIMENQTDFIDVSPVYVTGGCNLFANNSSNVGYMVGGSTWSGNVQGGSFHFSFPAVIKTQGVPFIITLNLAVLPTLLFYDPDDPGNYADNYLLNNGQYGVSLMLWNEIPMGQSSLVGQSAISGWGN